MKTLAELSSEWDKSVTDSEKYAVMQDICAYILNIAWTQNNSSKSVGLEKIFAESSKVDEFNKERDSDASRSKP